MRCRNEQNAAKKEEANRVTFFHVGSFERTINWTNFCLPTICLSRCGVFIALKTLPTVSSVTRFGEISTFWT